MVLTLILSRGQIYNELQLNMAAEFLLTLLVPVVQLLGWWVYRLRFKQYEGYPQAPPSFIWGHMEVIGKTMKLQDARKHIGGSFLYVTLLTCLTRDTTRSCVLPHWRDHWHASHYDIGHAPCLLDHVYRV